MKDLFIGSEGTLGIITEVLLKLVPRPAARRTMLALYDRIEDAAETVSAIIAARIIPCTLEFLDRMTAGCVEDYAHVGLPTDCDAVLLMETDGHPGGCRRRERADGGHRARSTAPAKCEPRATKRRRWRWPPRGATRFPRWRAGRPTTILEDVTVPRSELAEMVAFIAETAREHRLEIGTFGHMGDGNLHPTFLTDERNAEEMQRVHHALDAIVDEDARARRDHHRRAWRRPGEEGVAAPADGREQLRADEAGQAPSIRPGLACNSRKDLRLGQPSVAATDAREHHRLRDSAAVHALRHVPADVPDLRHHEARAQQPARPHRADARRRRRRSRGHRASSPTR